MCGHFLGDERRNTRQTRASRDVLQRFCFQLGQKYHFVQVATFSGARHTPENIETQIFACLSIALRADNAIPYRDVCRACQILRLRQAYLFLSLSRGFTHTSIVSNVFYGHLWRFCFLGEQRTQFFARVATWLFSDGRTRQRKFEMHRKRDS